MGRGTMEIQLEDINRTGRGPLFINGRSRISTATSVRFLDNRTIVCASLVGQRLYLIDFDLTNSSFRVLDSLDTTFEGVLAETDLMDIDDQGNIVTSNFYRGSATLYCRSGSRIHFVRDLHLGLDCYVHGIRLLGSDTLAVTATKGPKGIHFFDFRDCQPLFYLPLEFPTKDLCVLPGGNIAVIVAHGTPQRDQKSPYSSEIHLYELDIVSKNYKFVDSIKLYQHHCDTLQYYDGKLLVIDQTHDRVLVIDTSPLSVFGAINGFNFPHGLDAKSGLLAVTNYGLNSVSIRSHIAVDAI